MPDTYFEPVIGASFDSLAAQRQFWAGLNNATQTGNVNRAASAQQEQNNYFQQLAANRQAAINRQAEMDWMGQQADVAQQAQAAERATRAHQFDVNTKLTREEIASRDAATQKQLQKMDEATAEKAREFDLGTEQQKQLAADELQNTGQSYAATYAASQRQMNAAEKAANDLQAEHDDLTQKVADAGKKTDNTPEELRQIQANKDRLAVLKKLLPKVLAAQSHVEQQHLGLSDKMLASGFVPNEEDGTLTHLSTGKSWTFNAALQKAKDALKNSAGAGGGSTSGTGTSDYFGQPAGNTQTATNVTHGVSSMIPPAPTDKAQRNVGTIYLTPKGPMRWVGNGWQSASTPGTF